jgi:surface polysaccharide O-acyltransferase-like enzyme
MTQYGSSTAPTAGPSAGRLGWLDAARVLAALLVIMIHCSADPAGNAFNNFPKEERIIPVMMRMVGEVSGAELFLVFSLFILAMRVDRPNTPGFGPTIRLQGRRLLVPFAAWSVFYLCFRFVKASAFGYTNGLVKELSDWHSWIEYVLMGTAQYHLHFLPTLFVIMMFYPVLKAAIRFPLIGLSLIPLLYCMDTVQERIWALVTEPTTRDLLARAVKDICYTGYGFAAFSVFGIWRRGMTDQDTRLLLRFSICLSVIAFLGTMAYAGNVIMSGFWVNRPGASFYAHLIMPVLVFLTFMAAQNVHWGPVFGRIARLNFGIYLIHPVFIDLYEIGTAKAGLHLDPAALVSTKYAFATVSAFTSAYLISKIRPLAWTIGLGSEAGTRAKPAPGRATNAPA